jgi:uncharacterized membrane protein
MEFPYFRRKSVIAFSASPVDPKWSAQPPQCDMPCAWVTLDDAGVRGIAGAPLGDRRMRAFVPAALILALAGCGGPPPDSPVNADNAVMAPPPPSLMLGDFELNQRIRVFGADTRWSLDMGPGQILFTDLAIDPPVSQPFYWVAPVIEGETATYTTQRVGGEPVVLRFTRKDCHVAAEPGQTHPITAVLTVGGKTSRGCAGPRPDDVPAKPEGTGGNSTAP